MATTPVTVAFEGKDLISGVLRGISNIAHRTSADIVGLRRVAGDMYDGLISGGRRAGDSLNDLGRQAGSAADEVRGLGRERVDDLFSTARRGADDLRRAVGRTGAEIHALPDAHVQLRARDDISPALDGIGAKISAITAAAGGIVIGGNVSDSLMGGVSEYNDAASRSASYLSATDRQHALKEADRLYAQGYFESRSEGAQQVADIAPLVSNKSKIGDYISSSAKMQYIMPDLSPEESNRALSQATNVFKETPQQIADSMMYAYSKVGDRQQDLADTFWEYSGYFKKTGATSGQMSNFLTKSVQAGSFNFDKPADFIKETFGVKALDAGDMEKYFVSRGSSKDVAKKQAEQFTSDINSSDVQRARGALMALVGDLSSQKPDELKASLVQLGSATAEDNGDAILKTWKTMFEKPPAEISGTTDRLVQAQQDANPMLPLIKAQHERDLLMQEIGGNIAVASLPALKEFNTLIVQNRDSIEGIGTSIASMTTKSMAFYKEHFTAINYLVAGLAGIFVAKKAVDLVKGGVNLAKGTAGVIGSTSKKTKELYVGGREKVSRSFIGRGYRRTNEWAADTYAGRQTRRAGTWVRESRVGRGAGKVRDFFSRKKEEPELEPKRFTRPGRKTEDDPFRHRSSLSSMTIQAGRVYVNGSVSGGGDRGIRERNPGNDRSRRRGTGYDRDDIAPKRRKRTLSREKGLDLIRSQRPEQEPKKGLRSRAKDAIFGKKPAIPETGLEQAGKLAKLGKFAKGAGIIGTVASAGLAGYDIYQSAKTDGWKQALSTRGGAMAGGVAGGAIGGVIGSVAGPIGTAAGAYLGNVVGEKLGSLADSSGLTAKAVDKIASLKDTFSSWKDKASNWISGKDKKAEEEKANMSPPKAPPSQPWRLPTLTPEAKKKMEDMFTSFRTSMKQRGMELDLTPLKKTGQEVKDTFSKIKQNVTGIWKGTNSTKAQHDVHAVGTAAKKTESEAKRMGIVSTKSTRDMAAGAHKAGQSFTGISATVSGVVSQVRQKLDSLSNISSKGSTWGSNLMSMLISGIRSKFPDLTATVSSAAGVLKKYLGFSSPTKEGPASRSDKWAPNFISMFSDGLDPRPVRERMNLIAGTMNQPLHSRASLNFVPHRQSMSTSGHIPVAQTLNQSSRSGGNVTIQSINLDFGEMAKQVTNFAEFAKMMTSPEGRALIRKVFGEELYYALENGG
ncbi:hypothetical protein DFP93_103198 [Aneurinibacillus soli]|uniref:Uncharacterized protein n=1 Tax=Aneurinibacillus soli TaxID=1500254 RepID=A0A0U4WKD9_9BACL|nr:tail tape measure protein [Aneurinibacillus soli]PYE62986.1 hypothetical protein DFP93_103198 [Aneurinibacillus soli]BAU28955.1 hypothetical protein CB4_03132 [Aneurinibacillus soli]